MPIFFMLILIVPQNQNKKPFNLLDHLFQNSEVTYV